MVEAAAGAIGGKNARAPFAYPVEWILEPSNCPNYGTPACTYRPNFDGWEIGDLILTSRIKPDIQTWFTRTVQGIASRLRRRFPNPNEVAWHCAWDHAAIYVGRGMLVEARPGSNVQPRPVSSLFPLCRVQVRRIRERGLRTEEKLTVLQEAIAWTVRAEYGSLAPIVVDALCALCNLDRIVIMDRTKKPEFEIQCSELWATIMMNAIIPDSEAGGVTNLAVWKLISRGLESRGVLPPELSAESGLDNVSVSWQT